MRKLALLFAVVAAVGCGGSGNSHLEAGSGPPAVGSYTGQGSIATTGSTNPDTAPIQTASVDANGNAHIVVGPFPGHGDTTYTINGTFETDRVFRGTITPSTSATGRPVSSRYTTNGGQFELTFSNYPIPNQALAVVAQLEQSQ